MWILRVTVYTTLFMQFKNKSFYIKQSCNLIHSWCTRLQRCKTLCFKKGTKMLAVTVILVPDMFPKSRCYRKICSTLFYYLNLHTFVLIIYWIPFAVFIGHPKRKSTSFWVCNRRVCRLKHTTSSLTYGNVVIYVACQSSRHIIHISFILNLLAHWRSSSRLICHPWVCHAEKSP